MDGITRKPGNISLRIEDCPQNHQKIKNLLQNYGLNFEESKKVKGHRSLIQG